MILDPSVYGNSGDGIKAFVEDQICENGPRPDRVSKRRRKKNILANFDLISAPRIKKIIFEEPIRLSIAVT